MGRNVRSSSTRRRRRNSSPFSSSGLASQRRSKCVGQYGSHLKSFAQSSTGCAMQQFVCQQDARCFPNATHSLPLKESGFSFAGGQRCATNWLDGARCCEKLQTSQPSVPLWSQATQIILELLMPRQKESDVLLLASSLPCGQQYPGWSGHKRSVTVSCAQSKTQLEQSQIQTWNIVVSCISGLSWNTPAHA